MKGGRGAAALARAVEQQWLAGLFFGWVRGALAPAAAVVASSSKDQFAETGRGGMTAADCKQDDSAWKGKRAQQQ